MQNLFGAKPRTTSTDRARVAKRLLDAENAFYAARQRHEAERSDESREALTAAEQALKAAESWAEQVSTGVVMH